MLSKHYQQRRRTHGKARYLLARRACRTVQLTQGRLPRALFGLVASLSRLSDEQALSAAQKELSSLACQVRGGPTWTHTLWPLCSRRVLWPRTMPLALCAGSLHDVPQSDGGGGRRAHGLGTHGFQC